MTTLQRSLLAASTLAGACILLGAPASSATFNCSSSSALNDAGPLQNTSGSSSCSAPTHAGSGGIRDPRADGSSFGLAGSSGPRVSSQAVTEADRSLVASSSSLTTMSDTAVVSGLAAGGADVTFSTLLNWKLRTTPAYALPVSVGSQSVITAGFSGFTSLSTDSGASGSSRFTGCDRLGEGISVCNGAFDELFPTADFGTATLNPTIHLNNGDHLSIYLETRASAFMFLAGPEDNGFAVGNASLTWGGVRFDPAAAGLTLIGSNGFDYARPISTGAVPEPATWAMMILGFGAAGAALRRRQVAEA